jgi:hypothetical protein
MTPEHLAELERLADAATPGPWTTGTGTNGLHPWEVVTSPHLPAVEMHGDDATAVADAVFIAAARQAVPALVAEVRRLAREAGLAADLRQEITRLRAVAARDVCSGCMVREEQREHWMEQSRQNGVKYEKAKGVQDQLRQQLEAESAAYHLLRDDRNAARTELDRTRSALAPVLDDIARLADSALAALPVGARVQGKLGELSALDGTGDRS